MNFDLAERNAEVSAKLAALRTASGSNTALRLRGSDWFAWATAGASNVVLLTTETGIAELLITAQDAWVLTDEIEAQRLIDEELPSIFKIQIQPWAVPAARETAVQELLDGATVLSDRPRHTEKSLPAALLACKRNMSASEITRYRQVGRLTSAAMCEVLRAARPEWSEYQLAGAGAEALWARGLHPALTLAAGEQRLPIYRHPTASSAKLGSRAMLVFCARGFWLTLQQQVGEIEAQALEACRPGVRLNEIYQILATAYRTHGHTSAINEHHQGGTTGYMAREIVATPDTFETLSDATPIAWNPSLRGGAKIEDTFIVTANGLEDMTYDATWPYALVHGRLRPQVLEQ
jgi:Xaa-Pro aminopeptidase